MTNEFLKKEIEEVEKEIDCFGKKEFAINDKGREMYYGEIVEKLVGLKERLRTLKECQSKEKEKHKKFVDKLKEFLRGYTPNYNYVCEQIDKLSSEDLK